MFQRNVVEEFKIHILLANAPAFQGDCFLKRSNLLGLLDPDDGVTKVL
jgi:hypothetical protein